MTMRDMTREELDALRGLRDGDLGPLGKVLGREDLSLHPLIQRALFQLITGTVEEVDYRLKLEKHPDLGDMRNGIKFSLERQGRELAIALTYAENGGFIRGRGKEAQHIAEQTHHAKRTVVKDAWKLHRRTVALAIRAGHVEIEDRNRPTEAQIRAIIRPEGVSART